MTVAWTLVPVQALSSPMSETAHNFSSTTTIRDELGANYTSKKCSKPVGIGVSNSIENSSCGVIIPPSISSCSAVFGTTLLFNFEVCLPISTSKAKPDMMMQKMEKANQYEENRKGRLGVLKEREKSSSGNFTPRSFVREVICKQVITDLKLVLKELTISRMGYGQRLIWKRDFASRFSAGFGMIRQSTDRSPIVVRATFSEDEESVELQEPDPDSGGKTSLEENVGVTSASSPLEDVVLFSVDRMTRTLYNLSVSSEESSHPVLDVLGPSTRESHSLH
ncbi:hypothetical protein KIL84_001790 [Mauremys mutica]|uniref:Uncharacterized protein n=1 Tax=Mauremys mutica TaxID=74926 RepID=A0A9D4B528_9SAUR|nr:hypothetical protein KIL84_001790 [Mauremys mutica]